MTRGAGLRLAVLAAAALAAGSLAAALAGDPARPDAASRPGTGRWYAALAGVETPPPAGTRSACGLRLGPGTLGIADPVLPCGARLVVRYGGRAVAARVVDRRAAVPGRDLELTPALARALRLHGTQTIRWRFAR